MSISEQVKHYYGKVLKRSSDLQTDACCTPDAVPPHVREILANIHPEVQSRYYGCGLVAPEALEGCSVLDLGCGSGRDVYLLSALVGENGSVTGIDMTFEQLEVARRHLRYHTEHFGYVKPNVEFREGELEQLEGLGLEGGAFDVAVSNCVLNLVTDKLSVLRQVFRLLKPGGEFYFADVYTDRRMPEVLRSDPVLYGECLGGALYWNDFLQLAKAAGFTDPRLVTDRPIGLNHLDIEERVGNIRFYSATYRLIKLDELEHACEDYGQAVKYKGTIPHHPHSFYLDKHHVMETGRMFPVCGNTYRMLNESRFARHFEFYGDTETHYGIFSGCGAGLPFGRYSSTEERDSCC